MYFDNATFAFTILTLRFKSLWDVFWHTPLAYMEQHQQFQIPVGCILTHCKYCICCISKSFKSLWDVFWLSKRFLQKRVLGVSNPCGMYFDTFRNFVVCYTSVSNPCGMYFDPATLVFMKSGCTFQIPVGCILTISFSFVYFCRNGFKSLWDVFWQQQEQIYPFHPLQFQIPVGCILT